MSNIALFSGGNLPAFAQNRELSDTAKSLAGGGGGSGKRISIKGGVFRLLVGGKEVTQIEDRHLDVVIVKAAPKVSRVFYAKQYDGDAVSAPDCWSADGDTPDKDAANKQASRCAECAQNIAGSGQGQSRACRFQQRVAVVLADEIDGDIMQLTVPAASLFGKAEGENRPLQEYARFLVAQSVGPDMVVTRMKFDTKAESPKLFFKPMRWLTDDEYATVQEKAESAEATQAVTMTVAKQDGVQVAAPKIEGAPPKAKKAAPSPVVEEEDEEPPAPAPKAKAKKAAPAPAVEEAEDVEEPAVRKEEVKKPAVATKGSLADMVGEWDDE
jgi:hypothetical protein